MITVMPESAQAQFEDEGYIILKGIIEPEIVQAVQNEMKKTVDFFAELLMNQHVITDPLKHLPFDVRFAELYKDNVDDAPMNLRHFLHRSGVFDLFFNPRM